jgi:hypothetical protein
MIAKDFPHPDAHRAYQALIGATGAHKPFDADTAVKLLTQEVTAPPAITEWVKGSTEPGPGASDSPAPTREQP